MGYRVSWIARAGTSTEELLTFSKRERTGERHDFCDVGWYLLELPNGVPSPWSVLIADGSENYCEINSSDARKLSEGENETLYFSCSDTVMATVFECFKNGSKDWSIQYSCENKDPQPELTGNVPTVTHELLADLRKQQLASEGADYIYDLTAELGRKLLGFRHDMDLETDDPEPFQVLSQPPSEKKPWWKSWKR